jgi:hypothetical protein
MMRMVSNLRNELAGISSGMARRDSFIMGSGTWGLDNNYFYFNKTITITLVELLS